MHRLRALPLVLLLASCSFVDDFGRFHATDASSDAGDAATDASTPLTLATFMPQFLDGLCHKSIRCETKLGIGGLMEIFCHPKLKQFYLDMALGNPASFDPTIAQQCLDGLADVDCSISNTFFVPQCERVFSGTVPNGSPCMSDFNCTNGRCETPAGMCGNVCVAKGNQGDACVEANQDNDCNGNLRCRGGTCQPPGDVGGVCESASDCGYLLWCDLAKTCQPVPNSGDTCVIDGTTSYADPCRGSLVCALVPDAGTTHQCSAGGTAGQACSSDAPCAPGHRCKSNVCHAISAPGGSCISRDDCPFLHECVSEVCVPYGDVGDACSPTLPCYRGSCVGGTCTLLADGQPCDGSNGILGGQCMGYCNTTPTPDVCAPRVGLGATCTSDYQCQDGLGCPSGTCVACN